MAFAEHQIVQRAMGMLLIVLNHPSPVGFAFILDASERVFSQQLSIKTITHCGKPT